MKCLETVVSFVLLALCLHVVSGEVVNFQKCPGEEKCTIHEVSITPCPEAAEGTACTVYRGANVSITFDFTPKFAADELAADVSWARTNFDLPFVGMDTEACKHTNCPVVSDNRQTYTYNLPIKKEYPPKVIVAVNMKYFQTVISVVLLAVCLHTVAAEVVIPKKCPFEPKCKIHEVTITPCPEAAEGRPCTVYRGRKVNVTLDFTPEFAATELTALVAWQKDAYFIPLGVDSNACGYTECPLVAGNRTTYSSILPIKKTLPLQRYDVFWQLSNGNEENCCFMVQLRVKAKNKPTEVSVKMKYFQKVIFAMLLALHLHVVSTKVVNFTRCPFADFTAKCKIHEISIAPCLEAEEGRPCTIYSGRKANVTLDFTPEFAANELTALVGWEQGSAFAPLNVDSNACGYTQCPVISGNRQTYTYRLPMKKELPLQHYNIFWQLSNEKEESCCFVIQLRVKAKPNQTED
uniref:MD-2-related lipid-recognition domain-containing protein n=1 Tax=Anopheles minimus TaxID=112268 RepID=A0A182WG50_9DIPT